MNGRRLWTGVMIGALAMAAVGCGKIVEGLNEAKGEAADFYNARKKADGLDEVMAFYTQDFVKANETWRPELAHLQASLGPVTAWKSTGVNSQYRVATGEPHPGTKVTFTVDVTFVHGKAEEKVVFYKPTGSDATWGILEHAVEPLDASPEKPDALIKEAEAAVERFLERRKAGDDAETLLGFYSPLLLNAVGRDKWKGELEHLAAAAGPAVSWSLQGEPEHAKQAASSQKRFIGEYVTLNYDVVCANNMTLTEKITMTKVFGPGATWVIWGHHYKSR